MGTYQIEIIIITEHYTFYDDMSYKHETREAHSPIIDC